MRPLLPTEVSLIAVFERSADLLIGERWLRWHYLEARRFEDPQAVAKGLARGLRRLERPASYCKSKVYSVINFLHIYLIQADPLIASALPLSGSMLTSAPFNRGSPVATSKWAGTSESVDDKTRSYRRPRIESCGPVIPTSV